MRQKISKFTTSMMGLFGDAATNLNAENRIQKIREAMLDSLSDLGNSPQLTKVSGRVLYAPDLQSLWYLRGDMMTMLAGLLGESVAKDRLATITKMFNGLLPSGQKSRHSHLHK
jgi:hypothetical protein